MKLFSIVLNIGIALLFSAKAQALVTFQVQMEDENSVPPPSAEVIGISEFAFAGSVEEYTQTINDLGNEDAVLFPTGTPGVFQVTIQSGVLSGNPLDLYEVVFEVAFSCNVSVLLSGDFQGGVLMPVETPTNEQCRTKGEYVQTDIPGKGKKVTSISFAPASSGEKEAAIDDLMTKLSLTSSDLCLGQSACTGGKHCKPDGINNAGGDGVKFELECKKDGPYYTCFYYALDVTPQGQYPEAKYKASACSCR